MNLHRKYGIPRTVAEQWIWYILALIPSLPFLAIEGVVRGAIWLYMAVGRHVVRERIRLDRIRGTLSSVEIKERSGFLVQDIQWARFEIAMMRERGDSRSRKVLDAMQESESPLSRAWVDWLVEMELDVGEWGLRAWVNLLLHDDGHWLWFAEWCHDHELFDTYESVRRERARHMRTCPQHKTRPGNEAD